MKNNILLALFISLIVSGCQQTTKPLKLTAINPLAYTSVAFIGQSDTAIVSTYSGRIARRINGQKGEYIIAQLDDEIYSLTYAKKQQEIIASTLESGVVILDSKSGTIKQVLPTGEYWINTISLSEDESVLFGFDIKGTNFRWDVNNNYQVKTDSLPNGYIRYINQSGDIYQSGSGKVMLWNADNDQKDMEISTSGRLVDVDSNGNLLLLNHDELLVYDLAKDSIAFSKKHPDYPFLSVKNDTFNIPLQLKLTTALFAGDQIYSAGIDRSVRVWNATSGELLDDLIFHRATVSDMKVSKNQKQVVSVDLRGGIQFWRVK